MLQSDLPDVDIIKITLREPEYFGVLITRYEKKLMRYLTRLGLGRLEDREDVLQDVFLKVYKNLAGFNSTYSFSSWVYRITHNEAMTYFRKSNVRPEGNEVYDGEAALERITGDEDIVRDLDKKIDASRLAQVLRELPEKYINIVTLYYFEEKSYTEISDILEIPIGSVATNLSRGKVALKKLLHNYEKN